MKTLNKLFFSSYYSFKALYPWSKLLHYVLIKFVMPLLQIYFFVLIGQYAGGDMQKFIIIGNVVHIISLNAIMGVTGTIALDKAFGTLASVLVSPSRKIYIILERLIPNVIDGFMGGVIGMLYARLIFGISFENVNIVLLLATLFLISLSLSCFGIIFANLAFIFRDISSIANISYLLLLFISGINFPIERLPWILQKVSLITPLTHGINAVRMIINSQVSVITYYNLLITMFLGVIYFIFGLTVFVFIERLARKNATLDLI